MRHDVLVERKHGAHTFDGDLVQCRPSTLQSDLAGRAGHDQLGHQRIVEARNRGARTNARIHANAGAGRRLEAHHGAGGRHESIGRVLSIEAELKSVSTGFWVFVEADLQTSRNPELLGDDVHARDRFGDWVLHLHTRVDLQEAHRAVFGHDEFHGAGAGVLCFSDDRA